MKKYLLPAFLLLASPASAFLVNYDFVGTVDWGDTRGQKDFSGSVEMDGMMVSKLTINIGSYRYVHIPQFYAAAGNSPVSLMDCPIVTEDYFSGGDFQLDEGRNLWAFQWREGEDDHLFETGGKVTRILGDAHPTPEPASAALLFAGLAGLGGYRKLRRRLKV